jgi:hypothetical protein
MEYKALPILTKEIGEDRTIRQLFSIMGNIDDGGDRIWPGAFGKTINERAQRVKVLWQHDSYMPPVGVPVSMEEIGRSDLPDTVKEQYPDATGALLGVVKYLDTPRGNEILAGIRDGAITENSIGYDAIKVDFEEAPEGVKTWDGSIRNIREVRLWDISPVNWGMNAATTNVKDRRLTALYEQVHLLLSAEDVKAGRVLSARNLAKLQDALAMLQEVLTAAEPPTDEEDDGKALTEQIIQALALRERELSLVYGGLR